MSVRVSSCFKVCLAVAAFGWGGLRADLSLAQGQPAAERPEAQAEKPPAPRAGWNRPRTYHNGLLRLEEQLNRSFQFLKPNSAMDGLPTPPMPARPAAPVLNQKTRDLLDQRKNWAFANPEELSATPKPEEMFNLPEYGSDGLEKKRPTSIERFYQDLEHRKSALGKRNPLAPEDPREPRSGLSMLQDSDPPDDPNLRPAARDSERTLRKLLKGRDAATAPDAQRGGLLEILGLGQRQPSPEEELAQKVYLKDFRDWLNRGAAGPGNNLPDQMATPDPTRPNLAATAGFNPLAPLSRPDNYDPSLGAANPTLLVSTPQDATAKVLNQWNPLYTPPKVEPPKTPRPAPIFDVPRRQF